MTTMACIQEFLGQRRLALVGVSHAPNDFSRALFREFQRRGYDVVPVNPAAREIEGQTCYATVADVQPPVAAVLVMTPPAATEAVVRDCAAAGVQRVWMFRGGGKGAVSREAVGFCESKGIAVVAGECPFMFLPATGWIHRVHGWLRRLGRSYPR